jgi:NADH:ubiquinone oxidoreductase subunit K
VSVTIRKTTVALVTPNELRGRVNAVEMVFISASNELGAFESGVVAALVGTVTAVVAGGAATIAIAVSWTRLFPSLSRMGRLEDLQPEPT